MCVYGRVETRLALTGGIDLRFLHQVLFSQDFVLQNVLLKSKAKALVNVFCLYYE